MLLKSRMSKEKIASIIIARGGSKRLPRKNVLPFCGLPLVEWSIMQSCCSHSVGRENTYLSTDDDEIAAIGERYRIGVIRRPDWPNPDAVTGGQAFSHAVGEIEKQKEVELMFRIMPTSPVRHPWDIDDMYKRWVELRADLPHLRELVSIVPNEETILYKLLENKQAIWHALSGPGWFGTQGIKVVLTDRELYKVSEASGRFDINITKSSSWLDPAVEGFTQHYIEAKWYQQFDIDYQDSFELCEVLMNQYILKGRGEEIYYDYRNNK